MPKKPILKRNYLIKHLSAMRAVDWASMVRASSYVISGRGTKRNRMRHMRQRRRCRICVNSPMLKTSYTGRGLHHGKKAREFRGNAAVLFSIETAMTPAT